MGRKPNKPIYAPIPEPDDPRLHRSGPGTSGVQRRGSVAAAGSTNLAGGRRGPHGGALGGPAQPHPHRGKFGGCGFFIVVMVLLVIIAVVGFLVAGFTDRTSTPPPPRVQIPDHVPPKAAKPAPNIDIHHLGRTSEQLLDWAKPISKNTGIPEQALIAYGNAEVIARQSRPDCHITWNTLAGLGYVETRHGTYDGKRFGAAEIDAKGNTTPPIFGPQLNGKGFATVHDTDEGKMDGDKKFDRAMGPLQFIPESWKRYGVDADGNDNADPQNIDDAAASAVRLLCDYDRDLATPEGWTQAIRSYNQSNEYVRNVRDAAANYAVDQRPLG
ncbi:lytic transglycosylase domain-containing protein [uncultured Corynebacterium sp.]|uniref:lytic transglycosylase domain-containing protein n=1 Tax=uncultured Corynebacterium sp. TaxID=159447 RepID=UPI0025E63B50|nr:lytic murein transglycosylase [uncultured Corynebacterium sp.]